ncbi:hypothetical protein LGIHADK_02827 [Mannheimia haemolytica]
MATEIKTKTPEQVEQKGGKAKVQIQHYGWLRLYF